MTTVVQERHQGKPQCPSCGSRRVYHRIEGPSYRCQVCGHIWPAPAPVSEAQDASEQRP